MNQTESTGRIKGSYGIDAPYIPALLAGTAVLAAIFAIITRGSATSLVWWFWCAVFLLQVGVYLNTTLRGKFAIWRDVISDLKLNGNERALDVGCGRGMVLITTALRLTNGTSVGLDLWRSRDQSGNDPDATQANAIANGIGDRIDLQTGDMTSLPFPDASFDVVTASVAIQNVKDRELRRKTIAEIFRVTKPGGRIRIVDMQYIGQYRDDLLDIGAADVSVKHVGLNGVYGNFFAISPLVSAQKPV